MFRNQHIEDQSLSKVGILFCCALSLSVFVVAVLALPLKHTLPELLQQVNNPLATSHKGAGEEALAIPSAPAVSSAPATAPVAVPSVPPVPATPTPAPSTPASVESVPPRPSEPAAPRKSPSQPADAGSYTVRAGDTLYSIARRYGISEQRLASVNGIASDGTVRIGQHLELLPPNH